MPCGHLALRSIVQIFVLRLFSHNDAPPKGIITILHMIRCNLLKPCCAEWNVRPSSHDGPLCVDSGGLCRGGGRNWQLQPAGDSLRESGVDCKYAYCPLFSQLDSNHYWRQSPATTTPGSNICLVILEIVMSAVHKYTHDNLESTQMMYMSVEKNDDYCETKGSLLLLFTVTMKERVIYCYCGERKNFTVQ